jgi:hypothetical protein
VPRLLGSWGARLASCSLLLLHPPIHVLLLLPLPPPFSSGFIDLVIFVILVCHLKFVEVFWGMSQEMSRYSVKVLDLANELNYHIPLASQCPSVLLICSIMMYGVRLPLLRRGSIATRLFLLMISLATLGSTL